MSRRGVYPGSFNPPTVAHLRICGLAILQFELDRVDLAVSRRALAKEDVDRPLLDHRLAVLHETVADHPNVGVVVTDRQLLADIAEGYDVLIMGADKWHQVNDPRFYGGSPAARDAALARLPTLAIAPRDGLDVPSDRRLDVPESMAKVSSTQARRGDRELMTVPARTFDEETGAWTDPSRYERWLADHGSTNPVDPIR